MVILYYSKLCTGPTWHWFFAGVCCGYGPRDGPERRELCLPPKYSDGSIGVSIVTRWRSSCCCGSKKWETMSVMIGAKEIPCHWSELLQEAEDMPQKNTVAKCNVGRPINSPIYFYILIFKNGRFLFFNFSKDWSQTIGAKRRWSPVCTDLFPLGEFFVMLHSK